MLNPSGRCQSTVTDSLIGLEALLEGATCDLKKIHNVLQSFIESLADKSREELRLLKDRLLEVFRQLGDQDWGLDLKFLFL